MKFILDSYRLFRLAASWTAGEMYLTTKVARSIKNRYDPFTNFLGILLAGGYRSMNMVEDVTGYMISSLEILWSSAKPHFEKYPAHDGTLHTRTREKWRAQHYFFAFLM